MSLLKDYLTVSKEDRKGKCKAFKDIKNLLKVFKIFFKDEASGFFLLIFPSQSVSQSPLKMYLQQNLICLSHCVGNNIFVVHQIMTKFWGRNTCFGREDIFYLPWFLVLPTVSQRTEVSHAGGHLDAFPSQQCDWAMYSWGMHLWTLREKKGWRLCSKG